MNRVLVDERGQVAALLAGAPAAVPPCELVDESLRAIAVAEVALRAWRTLVVAPVEDLVRAVGGDARDVEQLRREGAMRRGW